MAGLHMFETIDALANRGPGLLLWAGIPFAVLFMLFIMLRRGSGRAGAFYAVVTTGMAGMSIEVSGLLAYQSYYGYLYDMLGALMAAFMLGLFGGGIFGRKLISSGRFSVGLLIGVDVCMLLLACIMAIVASYPPGALFGAAISLMLVTAGGLTGLQYPLSLELATRTSGDGANEANAGAVYGLDLMGAGLGAVAAGLVLVPLLGIAYTALTMVILKVSSSVFLATCRRV
jgi:spermidine synthase